MRRHRQPYRFSPLYTFTMTLILLLVLILVAVLGMIAKRAADDPAYRFITVNSVIAVKMNEWYYVIDTGTSLTLSIFPTPPLCIGMQCVSAYPADPYMMSQLLIANASVPKGTLIVGVIGENMLQKFRQVRVDYHNKTVEFVK